MIPKAIKCECGHAAKWHGPTGQGYCRSTMIGAIGAGLPASTTCGCKVYTASVKDGFIKAGNWK